MFLSPLPSDVWLFFNKVMPYRVHVHLKTLFLNCDSVSALILYDNLKLYLEIILILSALSGTNKKKIYSIMAIFFPQTGPLLLLIIG